MKSLTTTIHTVRLTFGWKKRLMKQVFKSCFSSNMRILAPEYAFLKNLHVYFLNNKPILDLMAIRRYLYYTVIQSSVLVYILYFCYIIAEIPTLYLNIHRNLAVPKHLYFCEINIQQYKNHIEAIVACIWHLFSTTNLTSKVSKLNRFNIQSSKWPDNIDSSYYKGCKN